MTIDRAIQRLRQATNVSFHIDMSVMVSQHLQFIPEVEFSVFIYELQRSFAGPTIEAAVTAALLALSGNANGSMEEAESAAAAAAVIQDNEGKIHDPMSEDA